ncbi:helix-turn-helix domain-containing protein [Aureispira sp. CCB-E]|uniref:helix-turn-helix domain-containing protein n=1 Tax=Aureispira sp. CCB-E TaxID=3051121 RepID=UPI00286864EE|nr:helix-turn-helix domain-containing protein [Aureispira sp. CCB-E]WMX13159.1 helix-turn-helix domain-containing protein [Aureispira sp. CCB-E]
MNHYKTIPEYCKAINISSPIHPHFDIRNFQDNMATVINEMPPFRHEFYAIAVKSSGSGKARVGHHTDFPEGATIFFNSPFQILSWDIKPNWEGFYIMFSQEFIAKSYFLQDILQHFPFLKIEKDMPFEVAQEDVETISKIYQSIQSEYQNNKSDKFQLIESYVLLLLNFVKRYFGKSISQKDALGAIRKTDLKLLSRFQTLIETSFQNKALETFANLHSTSYYAQKLSIHPNHLNKIVKEITGLTAKQHIQNHLLNLAKSQLIHTEKSIKEIAYSLYFDSPNNFSSFFKKLTSKSPNTYRKETIL